MEEIKVHLAKEGMIVTKDVYFSGSQVLIARRSILTDELITGLVARHIEQIYVSEDISYVQKFKDINERIDKRFELYRGNALMERIAEAAKKYFKNKIIKSFS